MRALLRELVSLAALVIFVAGIGSVGLLMTEHNDEATRHTVAMVAR